MCVDRVYWYGVLVWCIGMVGWEDVLTACVDRVYWYGGLRGCIELRK